MKKALIIGSGLGGLATALRLLSSGYDVTILEKNATPGGRLNQIKLDGFKFDIGPSFMSMTYETEELFRSCGLAPTVQLKELDPLYQVFFEHRPRPYKIWKNLSRLEEEFAAIEPHLKTKIDRYLTRGQKIFHDTEGPLIKSNFNGLADFLGKMARWDTALPPYLLRNMWQEVERNFTSQEVRIIFSLVAFFLGATPFETPAIYSLLNYIEFRHNGYWGVSRGMYSLVEDLVEIIKTKGGRLIFESEVREVLKNNNRAVGVEDQNGRRWEADVFVCNADAASFRGQILRRPEYCPARLDKMNWSFAPFTIYLGVKGKIENTLQHNYFLGNNFKGYAKKTLSSSVSPQRPYYYVHVASKAYPDYAPPGCESILILCPVPDLRFKKDWTDQEPFADNIINDFSRRTDFDVKKNTVTRKILTPQDWEALFCLYRGSGLGLCHGIFQMGYFRPKNKDEKLNNFYYVGASTIPGTGLPMVIVGSKLTCERIMQDHGSL
ncbi:MAG TPA: phytoene desaturase family protein [Candidatus Omnitrophota bacterium]|nr:phytoene desaturase [Candidatus Omnitrophota bacterium]HPB68058.1 phytoene desaturase family protein [Candidatus Omnitrophota bacterium]HQO58383.1 phytoene desaturase family protein [Candidatus Omnitrophota bacterium]